MTPLQIETLTPPPPPAMGPAEAAALLAYLQAATDAYSPAVSSGERVLLCAAVGWLREVAEGLRCADGPFLGFTIGAWECGWLDAKRGTDSHPIGRVGSNGWEAWLPLDEDPFAHGPETDQAGRDAVAAALRSRGAKL